MHQAHRMMRSNNCIGVRNHNGSWMNWTQWIFQVWHTTRTYHCNAREIMLLPAFRLSLLLFITWKEPDWMHGALTTALLRHGRNKGPGMDACCRISHHPSAVPDWPPSPNTKVTEGTLVTTPVAIAKMVMGLFEVRGEDVVSCAKTWCPWEKVGHGKESE